MAQLRAKQVKLSSEGDLLIGGTNGNGTILQLGSDTQVLKVVSGSLTYATQQASDVSVSEISGIIGTTVQSVIEELNTEDQNIISRIDDLNTSLGITGDSYTAISGSNYLDSSTSFRSADLALDAALKSVSDSISSFGNAFKYIGTLDPSTQGDLDNISDPAIGDYYKISASGTVTWNTGSSSLVVSENDGIVYNSSGGWDKIDNTNSVVSGGTNIDVSGSSDTGFVVSIDGIISETNGGTGVSTLGDITSSTTAITVTGGIGSSINDTSFTFNPENVDISDFNGTLPVSKGGTGLATGGTANGEVLTWDNDNTQLTYAYVTNLKSSDGVTISSVVGTGSGAKLTANAATVDGDDDLVYSTKGWVESKLAGSPTTNQAVESFTVPSSPSANYSVSISNTPVGDVQVSFNGLVLASNGYSYSEGSVSLVDTNIGYSAEEGDILTVTYHYEV